MKPIIYGVEYAAVEKPNQWTHNVEWLIYELDGVGENNTPYFAVRSADDYSTSEIKDATPWASITIKWDGCSHLYFHDDGYFHVCGHDNWKRFSEMIDDLFRRTMLLMEERDVNVLGDGSFPK